MYKMMSTRDCARSTLRTGYQTGEIIIGNVEAYIWVVLRSVDVSDNISVKLNGIAKKRQMEEHNNNNKQIDKVWREQ